MDSTQNWTDEHEIYLRKISTECGVKAKDHARASTKNKICKYLIGYPSIIIPLMMSSYNMIDERECNNEIEMADIVNAVTFLAVATLNSTLNFFNFAEECQLHSMYEHFYLDIKSDIDTELVKSRSRRNFADVFITKIQTRLDYTISDAPDLPPSCCCLLKIIN